ncbi:hypothetical protein TNCV_4593281 [Trichonephila clavipes]|uniref:Uncharacterized protein n=1 Tax=Trichonephila clavipes TaxID=2585209 RepID=A0A8X7BJ23_TRICX|nr:hypothetical protein TNCV_4593281 [Trichonephila clavipes]
MYIQDRFGSYRSIEWTKTDWNCTRYSIITCFAQTSDSLARLTQTLARMPDSASSKKELLYVKTEDRAVHQRQPLRVVVVERIVMEGMFDIERRYHNFRKQNADLCHPFIIGVVVVINRSKSQSHFPVCEESFAMVYSSPSLDRGNVHWSNESRFTIWHSSDYFVADLNLIEKSLGRFRTQNTYPAKLIIFIASTPGSYGGRLGVWPPIKNCWKVSCDVCRLPSMQKKNQHHINIYLITRRAHTT